MPAWRIILFAFVGKVVGSLFVALCVALGFGPTQWAEFIISGLPVFVTPGVVRLVFLLLGSLTLTYMMWGRIVRSGPRLRVALIAVAALPFVSGAFYVNAAPETDRILSKTQQEKLLAALRPIAPSLPKNIAVEAVSASPDAAGYALRFMLVMHEAGITLNGISPESETARIFPSTASVASTAMRGLYIGIEPGIKEPPADAIKFRDALKLAGFDAHMVWWNGVAPGTFAFAVSYR